MYNQAVGQKALHLNRALYTWHFKAEEKAANCIQCRECEAKCPQKIAIADWMPKVDKELTMPEKTE